MTIRKHPPSTVKNTFNRKFINNIIFSVLFVYFITNSLYLVFIKDTSSSYSLTQTYSAYFSLEDWNLSNHAYVDLDNDGKKDMVTFTNCVFLSTMNEMSIPKRKQCIAPGMSIIGFPDGHITIGQSLISNHPFMYQWLKKSYLVKTKNSIWKFYDMNGLQLRTYQLEKNYIFVETNPTIFDRIDTLTYQLSHLGIQLFMNYFWFHI